MTFFQSELVRDPETHDPLSLIGDSLYNPATTRTYPIRDGIPIFLREVTGLNLKYQTMYDRLAPGYDLAERLYRWIWRRPDYRLEYLSELEIDAGDKVLEVSVGTGANLIRLRPDIDFYGLDLSWGMLRKCRNTIIRKGRSASLFQGEAEHLPFRDEAFDCVFHVGGINFFNDKAGAIGEMIRVAKAGTRVLIVDETEKVIKEQYQKFPLIRGQFKQAEAEAFCPIDLVPAAMLEVEAKQIVGGKLYCLTFRKPA